MRYINILICLLYVYSLTVATSNADTDKKFDELDDYNIFFIPEISKPFYKRFKLEKGPSNYCEKGYEILVLPPEYKYCWWQYSEISRGGSSWVSIQEPGTKVQLRGIIINWKIQNDGYIAGIPAGARGSIVAEFIVAGVKGAAICPSRPTPYRNGVNEMITQDTLPSFEGLECTKPLP